MIKSVDSAMRWRLKTASTIVNQQSSIDRRSMYFLMTSYLCVKISVALRLLCVGTYTV